MFIAELCVCTVDPKVVFAYIHFEPLRTLSIQCSEMVPFLQMLRKGDLSLRDCVLRSPGHVHQSPLHHGRPHKYQTQAAHKERLSRALDSVRERGISVRRAAEEFNIPKSTLHDHLSGKVIAFGQSGPPR